jgi:hypothetical protein
MMMADVEEVVLEQLAATPRARVQQVHVGNGELLPGLDRAESPELDLSGTAWWRGAFLSVGRGVFVSWAGRFCRQLGGVVWPVERGDRLAHRLAREELHAVGGAYARQTWRRQDGS